MQIPKNWPTVREMLNIILLFSEREAHFSKREGGVSFVIQHVFFCVPPFI